MLHNLLTRCGRSREGARIEIPNANGKYELSDCRSREGARIEICTAAAAWRKPFTVAPARERGLKFDRLLPLATALKGRSREGARIEIGNKIYDALAKAVAPARERGLK